MVGRYVLASALSDSHWRVFVAGVMGLLSFPHPNTKYKYDSTLEKKEWIWAVRNLLVGEMRLL